MSRKGTQSINEKKIVPRCGGEHGYLRSRVGVIILNIFEINYSQLMQYEILEKPVTYINTISPKLSVYECSVCGFIKCAKSKANLVFFKVQFFAPGS